MRANRTCVQLLEDRVIKRQRPEDARLERERTERAARVAELTGLFHVPRIEDFDESSGSIVFERLPGAVPLSQLLLEEEPGAAKEHMSRCGQILAAIHERLEPAPSDAPAPPGHVALHGDFGLGNLLFDAGLDRYVVVDWATTRWLGRLGQAQGPPAVDLSVFLVSLFWRRLPSRHAIRGVGPLGRAFLDQYAEGRTDGLRLPELLELVPELARRYSASQLRRIGLAQLLRYPSLWQLRAFLWNLPDARSRSRP